MQALGSIKQHFWHPDILAAALFLKFHLNIGGTSELVFYLCEKGLEYFQFGVMFYR